MAAVTYASQPVAYVPPVMTLPPGPVIVSQPSGISRIWYLIFYMIYISLLLTALWFMISLSNVPTWVFFLFLAACIIWVLIAVGRETLLVNEMLPDGTIIVSPLTGFWRVSYWLLGATATGLTMAGFIIAILYSTIPWWVWLLILVSWLLSFLAQSIGMATKAQSGWVFSIFISVLAFITYIVAIIMIVIYANMPWWVWLMFGLAFLFSIIASVLEPFSKTGTVVAVQEPMPTFVQQPTYLPEQDQQLCPLTGVPATTVMRPEPVIVESKPVVVGAENPRTIVPEVKTTSPPPVVIEQPAATRTLCQAPMMTQEQATSVKTYQAPIMVQEQVTGVKTYQAPTIVQEQVTGVGTVKAVPAGPSINRSLPPLGTLVCGLPGSNVPRQVVI